MCSTILQRATVFYKWRLGIVAVKEKTRSELETRSTMETASTLSILALTENGSVAEGKLPHADFGENAKSGGMT